MLVLVYTETVGKYFWYFLIGFHCIYRTIVKYNMNKIKYLRLVGSDGKGWGTRGKVFAINFLTKMFCPLGQHSVYIAVFCAFMDMLKYYY